MLILRCIVGWSLVLLTAFAYLAIGTSEEYALGYHAMADDLYAIAGLWLAWAFIVLLLVRRELPLGVGRFVLRMIGIDQ